jgi:hypothetical protein
VIAILALAMAATSAKASTTFLYTGNSFTTAQSPYTTSDAVDGSFTLGSPLQDNLILTSFVPEAFSITDGIDTITNETPNVILQYLFLSTGPTGNITSWGFLAAETVSFDPYYALQIGTEYDPANDIDGNHTIMDGVYLEEGNVGPFTAAANYEDPGTLSIAPEPSTVVLLPFALLAATALAWHRRFRFLRPA